MARQIVAQSVKFLKLTVLSGATGRVKSSTPLKIRADYVIRQVSITADAHDIDREVSVYAGKNTPVNHLPDLQSYETAPLSNPENGIRYSQSDEIFAEVEIKAGGSPAANVVYLIAIDYWEVLPER